MDIVTTLSIVKHLGVIADRVEVTGFIRLLQDGSSSILGGINFEGIQAVRVGLLENGIIQDDFLKLLDGGGTARSSQKWSVLLCQFSEGFCNISKAMNKRLLIPEDSKCAVDLFDCGQLLWLSS
jgi:hypothetical protein